MSRKQKWKKISSIATRYIRTAGTYKAMRTGTHHDCTRNKNKILLILIINTAYLFNGIFPLVIWQIFFHLLLFNEIFPLLIFDGIFHPHIFIEFDFQFLKIWKTKTKQIGYSASCTRETPPDSKAPPLSCKTPQLHQTVGVEPDSMAPPLRWETPKLDQTAWRRKNRLITDILQCKLAV